MSGTPPELGDNMRFIDISGQRFGRLTVGHLQRRGKGKRPLWECHCDCGGTISVRACTLKAGHTRSCGCLHIEELKGRLTTHGKTGTPLYITWYGIKTRVSNPKQRGYKNYGGRGIGMHPEWADSFEAFEAYILEVLGEKPEGETLDRVDNEKGYVPGNLRWASQPVQARNTRRNVWLEHEGEKVIFSDLARKLGVSQKVLRRKIKLGEITPAKKHLDTSAFEVI